MTAETRFVHRQRAIQVLSEGRIRKAACSEARAIVTTSVCREVLLAQRYAGHQDDTARDLSITSLIIIYLQISMIASLIVLKCQ